MRIFKMDHFVSNAHALRPVRRNFVGGLFLVSSRHTLQRLKSQPMVTRSAEARKNATQSLHSFSWNLPENLL
jgi:hypothetical protein